MNFNMNIAVLIALVFITKIAAEEDPQTVPNPKIQSETVPEERKARSAEDNAIKYLIQLGRDPANSANVQTASQTGNQLKQRTAPLTEENSDTQQLNNSATKPAVDIFEVIPVVDGSGNTYLLSPDDFTQLRQQSIIFPLEEDDEIIASDGNGAIISPIHNGDDNQDVTATLGGQHMYIKRRGGRPGVRRPLRRRPSRRRGAIQRPNRRRSPLQSPDGISSPNRRIVQRRRRLQTQRRRQLQALNLRESGRPYQKPANKRCANKRLRRRRLHRKLT